MHARAPLSATRSQREGNRHKCEGREICSHEFEEFTSGNVSGAHVSEIYTSLVTLFELYV